MWVTRASARGGREQRRGPTGAAKGPNAAKGHVLWDKPEASWLRVYPIFGHRMGKNKGRAGVSLAPNLAVLSRVRKASAQAPFSRNYRTAAACATRAGHCDIRTTGKR